MSKMTISKYQMGEPIEGWNDCPIIFQNDGTRRQAKRRVRKYATSTPIIDIQTKTSPKSKNVNTYMLQENLNMLQETIAVSNNTQSSDNNHDERYIIEYLFSFPTSLTEKKHTYYKNKIENGYGELDHQHKEFVLSILQMLKAKDDFQDFAILQQSASKRILDYMIQTNSSSTFLSCMKKLVDSFKT